MSLCQSIGLTLPPSDKEKYIGAFLNLRLVNFEKDELLKFTAQTYTDLRTIRHKCAKQSSKQALSLPTNFAIVIVLILRFR